MEIIIIWVIGWWFTAGLVGDDNNSFFNWPTILGEWVRDNIGEKK